MRTFVALKNQNMTIAKESVVTMNYTLKNNEGEIIDTSEGREQNRLVEMEVIFE